MTAEDDDPEFALRLGHDYDDKQNAEDAREALLRATGEPSFWVDRADGIEGTQQMAMCLAECMRYLRDMDAAEILIALHRLRSKAVNGAGDD